MNVFFSSDTHFFHDNIIKYCNRPFSSTEEMNEKIIENWNSYVKDNDIIYHLGDFSINSRDREKNKSKEQLLKKTFGRLKGKKILIYGNHDIAFLDLYRDLFIEVMPYKEIKIDNKIWILCHYPIEEWNGSHSGVGIHLHGHSHGTGTVKPNRIDVGVDCHNFFPLEINEIKQKNIKEMENI